MIHEDTLEKCCSLSKRPFSGKKSAADDDEYDYFFDAFSKNSLSLYHGLGNSLRRHETSMLKKKLRATGMKNGLLKEPRRAPLFPHKEEAVRGCRRPSRCCFLAVFPISRPRAKQYGVNLDKEEELSSLVVAASASAASMGL